MNICIFGSSSKLIDQKYFTEAAKLGEIIGKNGHQLIHGGGKEGLMGMVADHVQMNGGKVIGIIPEKLNRKGVVRENDDQTIVTQTMAEQKARMFEIGDIFIALPGGFDTLEELLEIITLNQLGYLNKKVIIINTQGFYDHLLKFFEQIVEQRFVGKGQKDLYTVISDTKEFSL